MTENKLHRLREIALAFATENLSNTEHEKLVIEENQIISEIQQAIDERSELKEKAEKWDEFIKLPECSHSCDCTDCQQKCLRCAVQLRESNLQQQIKQLQEELEKKVIIEIDGIGYTRQELVQENQQLRDEIEKLKQDNRSSRT